ncbi:MAG: hypothetical protein ACOCZ8_06005 [Bacteroidota bacterium]
MADDQSHHTSPPESPEQDPRVQPDTSITFKLYRSELLLYTFRGSFTVTMLFIIILMYAFVLDFRGSINQERPSFEPLGQEYMAKPDSAELAQRERRRAETLNDDVTLQERRRPRGQLRDETHEPMMVTFDKFLRGDREAKKLVYTFIGGAGSIFFGFLTSFLWIILERQKGF